MAAFLSFELFDMTSRRGNVFIVKVVMKLLALDAEASINNLK